MIMSNPRAINPYDEVCFYADELAVGETRRHTCPKCLGGDSKEKSLSVSKSIQGRIFYNCFRAKCNWRGTIANGVVLGDTIQLPFARRLRVFDRPTEEVSGEQLLWYRETFHISPDNDVRWCESLGAYVYKVYGPNRQLRGWQMCDYRPGTGMPRSNYVHRDEPFISWYIPDKPEIGGVVVVEDIPSARKVASCGISSCALLGTHVDFERAYEIAAIAENFVILALDIGTLPKSIGYRQKYECLWGSVEIWQLKEDLKYVKRKRIKEAIYDGKSDFISLSD